MAMCPIAPFCHWAVGRFRISIGSYDGQSSRQTRLDYCAITDHAAARFALILGPLQVTASEEQEQTS